MLAGSDLDVIGIIGIVLLIGIVKKNAIMIVDFALEAEREHGKSPEEAIFEASLLRFRRKRTEPSSGPPTDRAIEHAP